jgi:hypothetical protein
MSKNPLDQGMIAENFTGIGSVTRKMVRDRAIELAIINGHAPQAVSKTDMEQAERELTGGTDADPAEAALAAEPGSTGRQMPESQEEGEDEDGRSETAQLMDEGIAEAEHDQMLQAMKKSNAN